jgi:hypothetical protein
MLSRIMLKTISKLRSTVASSKPSISVNKVDRSLSPTVALPLSPSGPVLQHHTCANLIISCKSSILTVSLNTKKRTTSTQLNFTQTSCSSPNQNKIQVQVSTLMCTITKEDFLIRYLQTEVYRSLYQFLLFLHILFTEITHYLM